MVTSDVTLVADEVEVQEVQTETPATTQSGSSLAAVLFNSIGVNAVALGERAVQEYDPEP